MARIRSAKPEFWTDPKMCGMSRDIRFTFKGIWEVSADDRGRFMADPRIIKANVWPLDDDITLNKLRKWLKVLADSGRIVLYRVEGIEYGYLVNWLKHQKIAHPTESRLPDPPVRDVHEPFTNHSGIIHEPFTLARAEGRGGEGSGGEGEKNSAPKKRSGVPAREDIGPRSTIPPDPDPLALAELPAPAAPPRVVLPPVAEKLLAKCYGLSTEKRRTDVAKQLYDALDPELKGARVRRGTYVKARDPAHMDWACQAVLDDPPRNVDMAVVFVLQKLQDPPPGPSPTEVAATRNAEREQLEERYGAEAKRAAVAWSRDHPEEYKRLAAPIEAQFPSANGNAFMAAARTAALTSALAKVAGFPRFEDWSRLPTRQLATSGAHE